MSLDAGQAPVGFGEYVVVSAGAVDVVDVDDESEVVFVSVLDGCPDVVDGSLAL